MITNIRNGAITRPDIILVFIIIAPVTFCALIEFSIQPSSPFVEIRPEYITEYELL